MSVSKGNFIVPRDTPSSGSSSEGTMSLFSSEDLGTSLGILWHGPETWEKLEIWRYRVLEAKKTSDGLWEGIEEKTHGRELTFG